MTDKCIGIWTADYFQVNGQALVTKRVVEHVLVSSHGNREYIYCQAHWLAAAVSWLTAIVHLWRDIIYRRIDVLYLVCSRSNAGFMRDIPALLAARTGMRVVVHSHGTDITELLTKRLVSPLARVLYSRCHLIVPSSHLNEKFSAINLAGYYVCENFTNTQDNQECDQELSQPGLFTVLWNSNLMASKGAFDLLSAVMELQEEGVSVELVTIGTVLPDEEMSLEDANRRFVELRARCSMRHLGRVSPARASELLKEADVVALPSRYECECQPLAVIDAMCAGKGLVVSDINALRATVEDYPAEFVKTRSIEDIKQALHRLYEEKAADPEAFYARRAMAANKARERFSAARFDREMREILQLQTYSDVREIE